MAKKKKDKPLFKPAGDDEVANRKDNTLFEIEKKVDIINAKLDAIIKGKRKK